MPARRRPGLFLEEFQVWHTYGTYFIGPLSSSLEVVAKRLVAKRLAVAATTSSGQAFAWDRDKVVHAPIKMQVRPDNRRGLFECELLRLGGYTAEAIFQHSWMAFAESRVTSSLLQDHAPYLRAFVEPIVITNSEVSISLYPQIKLYESGVVLLQLRLFSPPSGSDVDSLVNLFVNLPWTVIDSIDVPPTLLSAFNVAHLTDAYPRRWQKRKVNRMAVESDSVIKSMAEKRDFGDFQFPLVAVPIDEYQLEWNRRFDFVRDLFIAPLAFLLGEAGDDRTQLGNFWASRPSVFLIHFRGQPASFPDIDAKLRRALVPIVMRSTDVEAPVADRFPFENLRLFDDYLWVLGEAVTLCVFSRKAHRTDAEFSDPNRGNLIYEKIVIGEAMEFLRYSHHRALEVASSPKSSPEEALSDWRKIAAIETVIRSPSNFGEINDAFAYYEQMIHLHEMRARSLEALEIQRIRASERRAHHWTIIGIVIAVVFGLGSVAGIRDEFTIPLLNLMDLKWATFNHPAALLILSGLTFVALLLIAIVVWMAIAFVRSTRRP